MELAEAERVIERILQLHQPEPYLTAFDATVAVCAHCRDAGGRRVLMPCPTTLLTRKARQRS